MSDNKEKLENETVTEGSEAVAEKTETVADLYTDDDIIDL